MTAWVLAALLTVAPWLAADEARLGELAQSIAAVSATRADASALVAVGHLESGKSWDGALVGDHGHSVSVWAVWVCPGPECLPASIDTEYAARAALLRIRQSERACRGGGDPWSLYTTGKCQRNREARARQGLAAWLLAHVDTGAT